MSLVRSSSRAEDLGGGDRRRAARAAARTPPRAARLALCRDDAGAPRAPEPDERVRLVGLEHARERRGVGLHERVRVDAKRIAGVDENAPAMNARKLATPRPSERA
jgi:hypothetical protein